MASCNELASTWARLSAVRSLTFNATSHGKKSGWNGDGIGLVAVECVNSTTILFYEEGKWRTATGKELTFTNVFRWTCIPESSTLRLEHLRFGQDHPVYLFDLKQSDEITWTSIDPHVCHGVLYSAEMTVGPEALSLHWSVTGPTMNERIQYSYR